MVYKQFITAAKKLDVYINGEKQDNRGEYIEIRQLVGGRTGASCWDTGEPDYRGVGGEPAPEFDSLNIILEAVAPTMTFLKYKTLLRDLVVHKEESDGDYYGNYYNYATQRIYLNELFHWLKKEELL